MPVLWLAWTLTWKPSRQRGKICGNSRAGSAWSVAQSLSEILPDGDKEKQMLHGLLVSGKRSGIGLPEVLRQRRLL